MDATARATQPDKRAIRRLRRRVDEGSVPVHSSVRLDPSPVQQARVRARLTSRRPARAKTRLLATTGLLIVGAAAVVVMRVRPPAPVASGLQALSGPAAVHLTDDVLLTYEGEGWVSGTERDLLVNWDKGSLTVEVEPAQGIELQVATPEGSVWITGTAFTVQRDADLGTTEVGVLRGQVKVQCTRGLELFLDPGQDTKCRSTDPGLLVKQAKALAQHDDHEGVLDVTERGLAECAGDCGLHQGELLARRASAFFELGRLDQALLSIQDYRALGPGPRDIQLDRVERAIQQQQGIDTP